MNIKQLISERLLIETGGVPFIGYHCSHNDEIGEDEFYGEITDKYKDVVPLIIYNLPHDLKLKLYEMVGDYNNFVKEDAPDLSIIDLSNLPTEFDDSFESIMGELLIYINELINGWVFVFENHKETGYGDYCYKIYITGNEYTSFEDPNDFGAEIYVYYGNTKVLVKKDIN